MRPLFNRRAVDLSPDQKRKVAEIKAALAKSDHAVHDHFYSLDTFERSARKARSGRIGVGWPETVGKLRAEMLRARDRLDALDTGLRAQHELRASLTDFAAGFEAWERGLNSGRVSVIEQEAIAMQRHFAQATARGKAGVSHLAKGR